MTAFEMAKSTIGSHSKHSAISDTAYLANRYIDLVRVIEKHAGQLSSEAAIEIMESIEYCPAKEHFRSVQGSNTLCQYKNLIRKKKWMPALKILWMEWKKKAVNRRRQIEFQ